MDLELACLECGAEEAEVTDSQRWQLLAGLLLLGGLLYLLAPVLTPFVIAALFAYLGDPLVDRLETKMARTAAVMVVFSGLVLILLGLVLLLLPSLVRQVTTLYAKLPGYIDWLQGTAVPWLQVRLGIEELALDLGVLRRAITEHWSAAGGIAAEVLATVSRSGLAFFGWLANLVLIPVVTFYLLRDWDVFLGRLRDLLPRKMEPTVTMLAQESDEVLGAFLRGQFLVMLGLGAIYSIGLWLVGLDLALLIGMVAGLVNFVPYLGFIVGILAAGIAALVQFQDVPHLLLVVLVFGVGQIVESVLLTPLLVGDRIGLHPVAVIFAVLAGGQLFGFFGILLALPVAAVLMVLLRHAHGRYVSSRLYDARDGSYGAPQE